MPITAAEGLSSFVQRYQDDILGYYGALNRVDKFKELLFMRGLYLPHLPELQSALNELCVTYCQFFSMEIGLFDYMIDAILDVPERQTVAYISLLTKLIQEGGVFGYMSLSQGMNLNADRGVTKLTGHSLYDPQNLLALRIYIADCTRQGIKVKQELLHNLPSTLSGQKKGWFIAAMMGSMPQVSDGLVEEKTELVSLTEKGERAEFHQFPFLPDLEVAEHLCRWGKRMGRADHANRKETFEKLHNLNYEQLRVLFPRRKSSTHTNNMELVFGVTYDEVKQLFTT